MKTGFEIPICRLYTCFLNRHKLRVSWWKKKEYPGDFSNLWLSQFSCWQGTKNSTLDLGGTDIIWLTCTHYLQASTPVVTCLEADLCFSKAVIIDFSLPYMEIFLVTHSRKVLALIPPLQCLQFFKAPSFWAPTRCQMSCWVWKIKQWIRHIPLPLWIYKK